MTAVPVTRTWSSSEIVTASNMNLYLRDVDNFLLARPILEVYHNTTQSITTGSFQDLNFNSEVVDSSGMHSTVTNTNRATAVYPGYYDFAGAGSWASNATGQRGTLWSTNAAAGVQPGAIFNAGATGALAHAAPNHLAFLNVGDYETLQIFQSSGGNLNTGQASAFYVHMKAVWTSN